MQNSNCGAGLWSEDPGYCLSLAIDGSPPSNNRGEIAAAAAALALVPRNQPLTLYTDSTYVLNGLVEGYKKWEDLGWLHVTNQDFLKWALYLLRVRQAPTWIEKVKAHDGVDGNERADQMAKDALMAEDLWDPDMEVPAQWTQNGARLAALSFHEIYLWVRSKSKFERRTNMIDLVNRVCENERTRSGDLHFESTLWKSIRAHPFRRETTDFYFIALHGRTVCGPYFTNWGGDAKTECMCKNGEESLEHILTRCRGRSWRRGVWGEAMRILRHSPLTKDLGLTTPSYLDILGVGLRKLPSPEATWLYQVIISETAFVIWKLRNDEHMRDREVMSRRAKATLHDAIKRRAISDLKMAKLEEMQDRKGSKLALTIQAVWVDLLDDSHRPPRWVFDDHG